MVQLGRIKPVHYCIHVALASGWCVRTDVVTDWPQECMTRRHRQHRSFMRGLVDRQARVGVLFDGCKGKRDWSWSI